ncbi:MAG: thermonuclease family protein [Thermoguttaceae bacterium]
MARRRLPLPRSVPRRRLVWPVLIAILLLLLVRRQFVQTPPAAPDDLAEGTYQLDHVVDGDTLQLANGARVRLIGADAPETLMPDHPVEPWGPQATQFTEQFVAGGLVRLEFDRQRKDRYDRFLAYVWVGGRMLNEELIRAGLAQAALGFRYSESMKRRFRRAEQEARAAGRGIWAPGAAAGSVP